MVLFLRCCCCFCRHYCCRCCGGGSISYNSSCLCRSSISPSCSFIDLRYGVQKICGLGLVNTCIIVVAAVVDLGGGSGGAILVVVVVVVVVVSAILCSLLFVNPGGRMPHRGRVCI